MKITESKLRSIVRNEIKGVMKEYSYYSNQYDDEDPYEFDAKQAVEMALEIYPAEDLDAMLDRYQSDQRNQFLYSTSSELSDVAKAAAAELEMKFNPSEDLDSFINVLAKALADLGYGY